jgi:YVTN family beta-propeller protein
MLIFSLISCGNDDDDEDIDVQDVSKAAYIVNGAAETLSVFDIETSQVRNDVLTVGKWPNDVKILNDKAYIVNTGDNNVQMVDLEGLTTFGTIDIGDGTSPEKVDFVGEDKAYVTCNFTNSVSVVDLVSLQVLNTIEVGVAPWGVAVTGNKAYVCNTNATFDVVSGAMSYGEATVSVIDVSTDSVIKTIPVGTNPTDIAISGDKILVQCTGNYADVTGKLVVIDSSSDTILKTIDLGTTPYGIATSPDGKAYLTAYEGLIPVDIDSGTAGSAMIGFPGGSGLAFDSEGNGYITVPDWTGGGGDKLLLMDASGNPAGEYTMGGGAGYIAIRE